MIKESCKILQDCSTRGEHCLKGVYLINLDPGKSNCSFWCWERGGIHAHTLLSNLHVYMQWYHLHALLSMYMCTCNGITYMHCYHLHALLSPTCVHVLLSPICTAVPYMCTCNGITCMHYYHLHALLSSPTCRYMPRTVGSHLGWQWLKCLCPGDTYHYKFEL